jgi:exonuclease-1
MAMLSGCDYLQGLKGVGIKTAHKLLRKHKTVERTLKFIALDNGNVKVPKGYLEDFERAELAFVWQRVYCPIKKRLVHLNGEPEGEWTDDKDQYVGRYDLTLLISLKTLIFD